MSTQFSYRGDILEALWAHGVQPREATPPSLVHDFVSDLYRYEIRKLRDQVVRKEFPKAEYFDRVVALRRRYRVISMRPDEWLI